MSLEDSIDQIFTTADLFAPGQPMLGADVLYRMTAELTYPAKISALEAFEDRRRVQRLTVFHPYGPPFNVSAAQGPGVGEWRYED